VIGWPVIGYGAALTAVAALLALLATGDRRRPVLALGVLAGAAAPVAWNAILRATHAAEFFTDAPLAVLVQAAREIYRRLMDAVVLAVAYLRPWLQTPGDLVVMW